MEVLRPFLRPLAGLAMLVVATSAAFGQSGAADRGRGLAERLCARCHAIGPSGESPHEQAPPFRELAARYDVWQLEEAFAEGIVVGHPDMPAYELAPAEIGDLLTYLDSLNPERAK